MQCPIKGARELMRDWEIGKEKKNTHTGNTHWRAHRKKKTLLKLSLLQRGTQEKHLTQHRVICFVCCIYIYLCS